MYVYMYVCMYVYMYVCMYVCMSICMYVCIYVISYYFYLQYLQLARVPLDIMQECMRRMSELNKDIKPSAYSIRKVHCLSCLSFISSPSLS